MQPAKDRVDTYGVRFSAAMARMRLWVVAIARRQIGNARTQRHVWTRGIVIANSHSPEWTADAIPCSKSPINSQRLFTGVAATGLAGARPLTCKSDAHDTSP
jgi:hypothetical protein